MRLSKKVKLIQTQREIGRDNEDYFDPRKVNLADTVKDRLKEGIKMENQALKAALEAGDYSEPVYKPKPGIQPVKGT